MVVFEDHLKFFLLGLCPALVLQASYLVYLCPANVILELLSNAIKAELMAAAELMGSIRNVLFITNIAGGAVTRSVSLIRL